MKSKSAKINYFLVFILISSFAFILYGNTLNNGYAYDDGIFITKNEFTKKGIAGIKDIFSHDSFYGEPSLRNYNLVEGGRYRPLSIATFAIEYQFFRNSPLHLYIHVTDLP